MDDIDANKLAMIGSLLGENGNMDNINQLMRTAKMLSAMMNMTAEEPTKESSKISAKEEREPIKNDETRDRQIRALNAAIPFIDTEYQRGLYMAVKLMEINRFQAQTGIRAMSNTTSDVETRKLEMINAIDSCLTNDERREIGMFLKLAKAGIF